MARKRVPAGKRYPLNMRTTRELRDRIEAAARASGRSLVQEVEYRLERSFQTDDLTKEMKASIQEAIEESWTSLADLGRGFSPEENRERSRMRRAGIDPDAPDKAEK